MSVSAAAPIRPPHPDAATKGAPIGPSAGPKEGAEAAARRLARPSTPEVCRDLADVVTGVARAEAGDAPGAIGLLAPVAARACGTVRTFASYFELPLPDGNSPMARLRALENFAPLVTVAAFAPAGCYADDTVRIRRFSHGAAGETVICDAGPACKTGSEATPPLNIAMHLTPSHSNNAHAAAPAVVAVDEVLIGNVTVDGTTIAGSGTFIAWTCVQGSAPWPKVAVRGRLTAVDAAGWHRTACGVLGDHGTLSYGLIRHGEGYLPGAGTLTLADGTQHATGYVGVGPLAPLPPDGLAVDMSARAHVLALAARLAHLETQLAPPK